MKTSFNFLERDEAIMIWVHLEQACKQHVKLFHIPLSVNDLPIFSVVFPDSLSSN